MIYLKYKHRVTKEFGIAAVTDDLKLIKYLKKHNNFAEPKAIWSESGLSYEAIYQHGCWSGTAWEVTILTKKQAFLQVL